MTEEDQRRLKGQAERDTKLLEDGVPHELEELRSRSATDFPDARRRFVRWRRNDPFPDIQPALLNCGVFCDYVVATGMIFPFNFDKQYIKLASYDMCLLGKAVYWEAEGERREFNIERGKLFTLKANSIAFVTLEPYLQLPDYIALRFNLRITNVYRGLLLGTGPIIDPGYQGKLSIPLHNLTTNSYEFLGGDALISIEFTKLARSMREDEAKHQAGSEQRRSSLYVPFPEPVHPDPEKTERNVGHFLQKANSGSIQSSIPRIVFESRQAAERASLVAAATIVGIVIALAALISAVWDSHTAAKEAQEALKSKIEQQEFVQHEMQSRMRVMQDSIISIRKRFAKD